MARKKLGSDEALGVVLSLEERRFLRNEMFRRGWQQKEFAAAAGLSQMTVSSALRGYGMWAKNRLALYNALEANPVKEFQHSA